GADRSQDGGCEAVVIFWGYRPEVEQQRALLYAASHGGDLAPADGVTAAQRQREFLGQRHRGAWQRDAGGTAAADRRRAGYHAGEDMVPRESRHDPFCPIDEDGGIDGQRAGDGREGTGDRRLKGGEGQLVDAQGAGERVAQQAADQGLVAEEQAGLRAAEQLVAAGGDE